MPGPLLQIPKRAGDASCHLPVLNPLNTGGLGFRVQRDPNTLNPT